MNIDKMKTSQVIYNFDNWIGIYTYTIAIFDFQIFQYTTCSRTGHFYSLNSTKFNLFAEVSPVKSKPILSSNTN